MISMFGIKKVKISQQGGKEYTNLFILFFLLLCVLCACSRPIQPKSDFISIKLGEVTFTRYFDLMPKVDFEGGEAIRLSDFIDSAITRYPQIYAYRLIGSDGFYPAKKGSPDNTWDQIEKGYLKLGDRRSAFDASLGLPGRYFVKDVVSIELLRKIETKFKVEGEVSFSLIINMPIGTYLDSTNAFYNGREGIRLSVFIDTLTPYPENYTYNLISVQADEKSFSWLELKTGWWLLDLDMTKFYPDLGADSRILRLQTIELIPKSE
jgi:hypothetical protein